MAGQAAAAGPPALSCHMKRPARFVLQRPDARAASAVLLCEVCGAVCASQRQLAAAGGQDGRPRRGRAARSLPQHSCAARLFLALPVSPPRHLVRAATERRVTAPGPGGPSAIDGDVTGRRRRRLRSLTTLPLGSGPFRPATVQTRAIVNICVTRPLRSTTFQAMQRTGQGHLRPAARGGHWATFPRGKARQASSVNFGGRRPMAASRAEKNWSCRSIGTVSAAGTCTNSARLPFLAAHRSEL
jgi:hypothetical protein